MSEARDILVASDLHKGYVLNKHVLTVLAGASVTVRAGEAVAIIGPSGAGKSTLMHVLGGLDRPEKGSVLIEGCDVYRAPANERARIRAIKTGFVFQSYHLLPELNVLENTLLPAMTMQGPFKTASAMRNRAIELLTAVGLAGRTNHRPMELSGGEQQRVAVARALMNDPMLVLADEPTGNLDPATGTIVTEGLFALTRNRGRGLVIVTHNPDLAARCDRAFRISGGVLNVEG